MSDYDSFKDEVEVLVMPNQTILLEIVAKKKLMTDVEDKSNVNLAIQISNFSEIGEESELSIESDSGQAYTLKFDKETQLFLGYRVPVGKYRFVNSTIIDNIDQSINLRINIEEGSLDYSTHTLGVKNELAEHLLKYNKTTMQFEGSSIPPGVYKLEIFQKPEDEILTKGGFKISFNLQDGTILPEESRVFIKNKFGGILEFQTDKHGYIETRNLPVGEYSILSIIPGKKGKIA